MPAPDVATAGMNSAGTTLYVANYTVGVPTARPLAPQVAWTPGMTLGQGSWVALPEMVDGDGIEVKPSTTKLTHLRSPATGAEKVPGFVDAGQWSAQFNYSKGLLTSLITIFPGAATNPKTPANNYGRKAFALEFPDGGGWYFWAFLNGIPSRVPEDDGIKLNVTLEISGVPTQFSLV
ncbi:MAG TPA: hypothetical protein VD866_03100 [Urbifossiella sp.]|nr:hypothetical protein [Urbifossiella sp.]